MLVTNLEEVAKGRYKVFVDEQFAFVLYRGELSRFHIEKEHEIDSELYEKIKKEVVVKRGKKRILHLLDQMPRTEQQLRMKLRQNFYTEDVIDEAIEYAKSFNYLNDKNYARMYIQGKLNHKSRKELYCALLNKGISKNIIEDVLEENYETHDETEAIKELIRKKKYNLEDSNDKEKSKIYGYLLRKGFSYDDIAIVLRCD